MIIDEFNLYKELAAFCKVNSEEIETKFKRVVEFTDFNQVCYEEMFWKQRCQVPKAVKEFKEIIPGLSDAYTKWFPYYLNPRNKFRKGLDIQLGQWYEKALQQFLSTKGVTVQKKGFPYPDYVVLEGNTPIAYYEHKYIESPFLYASTQIKNTYPYDSARFDYEASLTLDTGDKFKNQRAKIEQDILPLGIPVHYIWWFDCFHIKGLFAYPAEKVFDYYDHLGGSIHVRKTREGDSETHQEIGKIYPPLLEMTLFNEYLNTVMK